MEPDDVRAKLDAGASLVQVWTGFVYRGPGIVRHLVRGASVSSSGHVGRGASTSSST